jgi:hypothetical protein
MPTLRYLPWCFLRAMKVRSKVVEVPQDKRERSFAVDLNSRRALRSVTLGTSPRKGVLFEGTLGTLKSLSFPEGMVLEVVGSEGTLQVDLSRGELQGNRRVRRK